MQQIIQDGGHSKTCVTFSFISLRI